MSFINQRSFTKNEFVGHRQLRLGPYSPMSNEFVGRRLLDLDHIAQYLMLSNILGQP